MTPVIDLRRFARAGERAVLVRLDGRQVRAGFAHVSTEWATVEVPHAHAGRVRPRADGAVPRRRAARGHVRGPRRDARLDVRLGRADRGRRGRAGRAADPHAGAGGEGEALAIRVVSDERVERVPVRIVDVAWAASASRAPTCSRPATRSRSCARAGSGSASGCASSGARSATTARRGSAAGWSPRRPTTRSACAPSPHPSLGLAAGGQVVGSAPCRSRSQIGRQHRLLARS